MLRGHARRLLERAVDLGVWLLEPEQVRGMPVIEFAERRQLHQDVPVPVVGVGQARSRCARLADRAEAACDAGVLADDDRVVRALDRLAVDMSAEHAMCGVEPGVPIVLAALVPGRRRAECLHFSR